jgi:hypothetical protein
LNLPCLTTRSFRQFLLWLSPSTELTDFYEVCELWEQRRNFNYVFDGLIRLPFRKSRHRYLFSYVTNVCEAFVTRVARFFWYKIPNVYRIKQKTVKWTNRP